MKPVIIIKAGSSFGSARERFGDFEDWTRRGLGLGMEACRVVDAQKTEDLPAPDGCSGVVVTGAHEMVSDASPWRDRLLDWTRRVVESGVPFLGICYGHQLLAHAMGGEAGYHPDGLEIGTVMVEKTEAARDDPLFCEMPERFPAHATHAQTALRLPPGAVVLARNAHEPHHAMRVGEHAWGVQFHPEYDEAIEGLYVEEQRGRIEEAGGDPESVISDVRATPEAAGLLRGFVRLVAATAERAG